MKIFFIAAVCLFIITGSTNAQKNIAKATIKSFKKENKKKNKCKTIVTEFKDSSKITTKPSLKINSQPANGEIIVGTDAFGRTIYQGPDQRKYYFNKQGQKEYIKADERLLKKQ